MCLDSEIEVGKEHSRKGSNCLNTLAAQCMLNGFATVMHVNEQTWYGDAGEEPDSKQRRLNLIKAVEGDDWSAVIDSQTQQTIEGMLVADLSFCFASCDTAAQAS